MNKDYYKKFSLGLVVDANVDEFEEFIKEYKDYIHDFYFSLPLGDKFHSRVKVKEKLKVQDIIENMYNLLKVIEKYNIKLELLFNTAHLTEDDFIISYNLIKNKNINISIVCVIDEYFELAKKYFREQEIVLSFNDARNGITSFKEIANQYDYMVVGRSDIRNEELFNYINKVSGVILLLNNGCSHICGGCSTLFNCHYSYYLARQYYSPEYLYALQSIFPSELKEINNQNKIAVFKIASRNANLLYLRKCINSYIVMNEKELIEENCMNYNLFARLSWHEEYFNTFSYENIMQIKDDIKLHNTLKYKNNFNGIEISTYVFNKKITKECMYNLITNYQKNVKYKKNFFIEKIIIDDSFNKNELIAYYENLGFKVLVLNKDIKVLNKISNDNTIDMIYDNNINYGNNLERLYNIERTGILNLLDWEKTGIKISENNKSNLFFSINYSFKDNVHMQITEGITKTIMENRAIGVISIYDK